MAAGSITGEHVRSLRGVLRAARVPGSAAPVSDTMPEHLVELVTGLTSAEVRAGLAWVATLSRATKVTPADARLWIDTAGLRGVRVGVREIAVLLGLSARHAHRRIRVVDDVVAAALNAVTPGEFRRLARSTSDWIAACIDSELIEAARADSYLALAPARALDAVTMYLRNRHRPDRGVRRPQYVDGNKDTRYRDASRVAVWLETLAADPPVSSTSVAEEARLTVCHDIHLAVEPRDALAQVSMAIASRQRRLLPLLLAHAGRLISRPAVAGAETWLSYLQLRFHAAMEAEHVLALRYARALQADAARLSPHGVGDPQVRRGMSSRGHILQMFGHYDAALDCFAQAVRHAAHFPASTEDQQQVAHDAHAQLVYTESLRSGRRADAEAALRRMNAYADRYGDRIEIQFTRQRRILEMHLGFAARRENLVVVPTNRRHETAIENDFHRFLELAAQHPSPNRLLAAQDLTLLYAILTRDARLATTARDAFQHVTDRSGGYANLTDRFNNRLDTAALLSARFRDIPPVAGPGDPLRNSAATPSRPTGLLVTARTTARAATTTRLGHPAPQPTPGRRR
jgi:hypothetical protein